MGFIRGGLLTILGILLVVSLIIANFMLTISWSLDYESVQEELKPLILELAQENHNLVQEVENQKSVMQDFCKPHDNFTYESESFGEVLVPCYTVNGGEEEIYNYVLEQYPNITGNGLVDLRQNITENYETVYDYCKPVNDFTFVDSSSFIEVEIPCNLTNSSGEEIISYGSEEVIKDIYYKDYDCSLWECVSDNSNELDSDKFYIVSKESHDYFQQRFYFFITLSLAFAALMFLFYKKKSSFFFVLAILIFVASLPFMKLEWVVGFFASYELTHIFSFLFSKSAYVFSVLLGFVFISVAIGVFLKGWIFGRFVFKNVNERKNS